MFKLDDNLLQELGLGSLPAVEKNKMLSHIYETLEMRVGMKLAEQMTNEQLDEFEAYIDRNDEPGALKWLETNFPNYKQVVADELEKLKTEIKLVAPQIVAASQADPINHVAAQSPNNPAPAQAPAEQSQPQPQYQPQPQPAADQYQQAPQQHTPTQPMPVQSPQTDYQAPQPPAQNPTY